MCLALTRDYGFNKEKNTQSIHLRNSEFIVHSNPGFLRAGKVTSSPLTVLILLILLAFKLPEASYALTYPIIKTCFSNQPSNQDPLCLKTQKLPTCKLVNVMQTMLNQAILDGAQSVIHPQFHSSHLSLWSIEAYQLYYHFHDGQDAWRKSVDWLKGVGSLCEIGLAIEVIEWMAWNTRFDPPGAGTSFTTLVLAWLLSDHKICDNLINMMFCQLAGHVEEEEALDHITHIETLCFMHDINKAKGQEDHKKPLTKLLHPIKAAVKTKKCLYFPHYWAIQHHWLVFKLDLENREISYCMWFHIIYIILITINPVGDALAHLMPSPIGEMTKL